MRLRPILTALAAATLLALTGCGSTESTPTTSTSTVEPTPGLTPDDMTDLVVDLTWQQQTEDDKDAMCLGLAAYGTEWGAEQMRLGARDESVDWERAAVLVEQKCTER